MQTASSNSNPQAAQTGQVVELRDGTRALIRPIGPWDRERLNEGFESASAESIFMRFLSPVPRLSSSQLEYLTAVDHVRHEALIAVDPETGQSFGTARYVRSDADDETAEFAIGVGDRWVRIGLGAALLGALVLRACDAGVVRFTGTIHADNTAIRRLVEKVLGAYEAKFVGQGAMEMSIDLRSRKPRFRSLASQGPVDQAQDRIASRSSLRAAPPT